MKRSGTTKRAKRRISARKRTPLSARRRIARRRRGGTGPLHKTRRSNPIKGRAGRTVRPVLRRKKRAPGYSRAYNAAFDQAYNEGFSAGFKQGLEDGQQAP